MTTSTRLSSPASTSTAISTSRRSTRASTSEDLKDEAEPDKAETLKPLLDKLKATLGDRVKDVRASVRLADSPSCIVSDEEEPSMKMQQMLRAMGQKDMPALKPTLEINPDHEIVKKLLARPDDAVAEDAAWLLFDQALLMEGVPLAGPGCLCATSQPHPEPFHLDCRWLCAERSHLHLYGTVTSKKGVRTAAHVHKDG